MAANLVVLQTLYSILPASEMSQTLDGLLCCSLLSSNKTNLLCRNHPFLGSIPSPFQVPVRLQICNRTTTPPATGKSPSMGPKSHPPD